MTQKRNPIKDLLKESHKDRIRQYVEQKDDAKAFLDKNPKAPMEQKKMDREIIEREIEKFEELFEEIFPYIRKIRSLIPEVLDQSKLAACYFLFGQTSHGLRAILMLAKEGFNYELMEILRSCREAMDLTFFFIRESNENPFVKKWFEGEIILNQKAREAVDQYVNEEYKETERAYKIKETMSHIYGELSKYSHNSYSALLDSFDYFHQDFDFERFSGFHYTRKDSLPYVRGEVEWLLISLKHFYKYVNDDQSVQELDAILRKLNY